MAISNGYVTLAEVKAAARITDSVDDALLETSIEASSRLIDGYTERRFYTGGTETRYYSASHHYWVDVDDLAGTAITLETSSDLDGIYDETWLTTDYQLEPGNSRASGLDWPVTRLRAVGDNLFPIGAEFGVKVTGVFGFGTAVPTAVKQACLIMSLRQFKRYDSALGVAGFGGDMGVIRVGRVDPDIDALLRPYRRTVVGVA
jgi:hypothetical protein